MGAYIVTTRSACPDCGGCGRLYDRSAKHKIVCNRCSLHDLPTPTRRAVATLAEVINLTCDAITAAYGVVAPDDLADAKLEHWGAAENLPDEGGTIELPDGTVIEVSVAEPAELGAAIGWSSNEVVNSTDAELCAAYNAAQEDKA